MAHPQSARGLAQSKTLRAVREASVNALASWTAVVLHRFFRRSAPRFGRPEPGNDGVELAFRRTEFGFGRQNPERAVPGRSPVAKPSGLRWAIAPGCLGVAAAEQREYLAHAVLNDHPIGQPSEIVSVTVAG